MPSGGRTYRSPTSEARITLLGDLPAGGADGGGWERLMPPDTGRADGHVHPDFAQEFKVLSGRARYAKGGTEGELGPEDSVEFPPGTPHVDPYNPFDENLVFRMEVRPAPPFTAAYAATLGRLLEQGKLNGQDELKPHQLFAVLQATKAPSRATGIPAWLQRPVIALGGRLSRALGFRVERD
jgi:hypothetical protein